MREFNLMKLGLAVRMKRKMLDFSVRELAEIVGVSAPTISRVENEEGAPDMVTFIRLCDWLGFEPNDFFTAKRGE